MFKYYEEKDWPSLPEDMVSSLVEWGLTAPRAIPSKRMKGVPPFSMLKAPWSLREWAIENIPIEIDERWVVTLQRFNAPHSPFHIDTLRAWSYNCVIYGETAVTHFKDDLEGEIVKSVKYEKNKWYYHNGSKPHGVTGINKHKNLRLAVTMYKLIPTRLRPQLLAVGTAPELAKAFVKDPYFYYV